MSVNWHYFKQIAQQTTMKQSNAPVARATTHTSKDLEQFTGYSTDNRKQTKAGRAWRAEELRLKKHEDLHKLWYVLLKEKNKLKSDFLMCRQLSQVFYGHSDSQKVALSMARLLTVVNERKKLRSEYRAYLENQYIEKKKAEEREAFLAHRQTLKAQGIVNVPMSQDEVKKMLQERDQRKAQQLLKAQASIKDSLEGATLAPQLNDEDVDFLATTKVQLSQKDIIKMYVGNWANLDLKQRRKVMGYVQAQRSKHAKEIFLKELSAIGRKFEQSKESVLIDSRIVGRKDPLKLKLESVTL